MPNFNEHIQTSTAITGVGGFFVNTIRQNEEISKGIRTEYNLFEAVTSGLMCACGGLFGSMIPDLIDLPKSPNHRGRFHSTTNFVYTSFLIAGDPIMETYFENLFFKSILAGNVIHILQDSQTPKGIPII